MKLSDRWFFVYCDRIPVWVTGIDGNLIAGVMGLLFLAGLTWIMSTDKHR